MAEARLNSIRYHDGCGNGYLFDRADDDALRFRYDPVQAAESSSGEYSGGAPCEGVVRTEEETELRRWIAVLEGASSLRSPNRVMGSGAFNISFGGEIRSFILCRGPELEDFEKSLARFRGA